MRANRSIAVAFPLLVWAGAAGISGAAEPPAFREFSQRVSAYVQQQRAPRQRTTNQRKEIVDRSQARARKIQETRAAAQPGDIFTAGIADEFRKVIGSTVRSAKVRATIREGAPVPGWTLRVNANYPEHLPVTTVPPTLLLRLPRLPPEVAYRIIGRDFVLQDTEARLVVDFIPGALP